MKHCLKIAPFFLILLVIGCITAPPTKLKPAVPSTAILTTITTTAQLSNTLTLPNPRFERQVNLGVAVGNGYSPRYLALNDQAGLLYIFTVGLPALKQGNGLSVYDVAKEQIVRHISLNKGSYEPLDLQFDPTVGLLYALWNDTTALNGGSQLAIVDTTSWQVVSQLPAVQVMVAANGLLWTVQAGELASYSLKTKSPVKQTQLKLPTFTQIGKLAIHSATKHLYFAHNDQNGWTMDIYATDTLTKLNSYFSLGEILDILPGDKLFVVEGIGDNRQLSILTTEGQPLGQGKPYTLGPRFGAKGIARDSQTVYFSNGKLPNYDPATSDKSGPALIGLDLSPRLNVSLPNNVDSLVISSRARQAFAVYPYDNSLYVVDLDKNSVQIVPTAIEIVDLLVEQTSEVSKTSELYTDSVIFVSNSARQIRRLDGQTLGVLAEIQLANTGDFDFGKLTLDPKRQRLYVNGQPIFVLDSRTLAKIGTLDHGGQVTLEPGGAQLYVSNCGVTIVDAATLKAIAVISGTQRRADSFVPNPCVTESHLDPLNKLLYSRLANGVPGSNGGSFLQVYDVSSVPRLIFTDTNINIAQVLPDPVGQRAFVSYIRFTDRSLRVLSGNPPRYTDQLWGLWQQMAYQPNLKRLYLSDENRLLAIDAATMSIVGEMALPPLYSYQVMAVSPSRVYLAGYDGQLLIATIGGAASRQESMAQMGLASTTALTPSGAVKYLTSVNGQIFAVIESNKDIYNKTFQLYRSADEGATWTNLSQNLPPWPVQAVAVSPNYAQDHTLYVALLAFGDNGGLYKSIDGGQTWEAAMRGLSDLWVDKLFIAPKGQLLLAHTQRHGLFQSVDGGQQWRALAPLKPELLPSSNEQISIDIGADGLVFATQSDGIVKAVTQVDGTLSAWQTVLNQPTNLIGRSPNGQVILADGFRKSADGGQTWQNVGNLFKEDFTATQYFFSPNFAKDQRVFLLFLRPYGNDGQIFMSENGGEFWKLWTNSDPNKSITAAFMTATGDFLMGDKQGKVTKILFKDMKWYPQQ